MRICVKTKEIKKRNGIWRKWTKIRKKKNESSIKNVGYNNRDILERMREKIKTKRIYKLIKKI